MKKEVRVAKASVVDNSVTKGEAADNQEARDKKTCNQKKRNQKTNSQIAGVQEANSVSSEILTSFTEIDRLWRAFDEVYRNAATKMGLSEAAFEVLYALRQLGEGCLQKDICQNACLGKQTVNSSVHKLVKEGILRLEPADSGRGTKIFLTAEGKKIVEEKVDPIIRADVEAFGTLTKEERAAAVRIETKYLRALRQKVSEATQQSTTIHNE